MQKKLSRTINRRKTTGLSKAKCNGSACDVRRRVPRFSIPILGSQLEKARISHNSSECTPDINQIFSDSRIGSVYVLHSGIGYRESTIYSSANICARATFAPCTRVHTSGKKILIEGLILRGKAIRKSFIRLLCSAECLSLRRGRTVSTRP